MADGKEFVGQQKAQAIQLPVQLTANSKQKKAFADSDSLTSAAAASSSPSGYYLNIAQKGKLILPTALWILLFIAGVCFLTLLASLNKTIGTLDTLVELEQEKEARASFNEQLLHATHRMPHVADTIFNDLEHNKHERQRDTQPASKSSAFVVDNDGLARSENFLDVVPTKASWLSMPSWMSLEPPMTIGGDQRQADSSLETNLVNDMLSHIIPQIMSGNNQNNQAAEISGAIIVSNTNPMLANEHRAKVEQSSQQKVAGDDMPLFDMLTKQVMPVFGNMLDARDPPKQRKSSRKHHKSSSAAAPLISAKIDQINVNLNSDVDSKQRVVANEKKQATREEEINSLEKSIDELVGKLISQKASEVSQTNQLKQMDDVLPIVHHHHTKPTGAPPLSPLASLLLPADEPVHSPILLQAALDGEFNIQDQDKQHQSKSSTQSSKQDDQKLIISIGSDALGALEPKSPLTNLISGEVNRHGLSNTRRPTTSLFSVPGLNDGPLMSNFASSPLDMFRLPFDSIIEQEQKRKQQSGEKHKTKNADHQLGQWDMFANDLADTLVQSVIQPAVNEPKNTESLVMVNGKPLAPNEQQKFLNSFFETTPSDNDKDENDKKTTTTTTKGDALDGSEKVESGKNKTEQANDLVGLLLGPSPDAKLVVAEPNNESDTKQVGGQFLSIGKSDDNNQAESRAASTTLTESIQGSDEHLMTSAPPALIVTVDNDEPSDKESRKEAEEMFGNIMSSMFTLPQFAGNQESPRPTNSGSRDQDGRPSSSTSNTSSGTNPTMQGGAAARPDNTKKESMVCECHKVNSTSPSSSSHSSSPSSGGSSNNKTSASPSSGNSSSSSTSSTTTPRPSGSSQGSSTSASPNRATNSTTSTTASSSLAQPIGYVPVVTGPNSNPPPFAAATLLAAPPSQVPLIVAEAAQKGGSNSTGVETTNKTAKQKINADDDEGPFVEFEGLSLPRSLDQLGYELADLA